MSHSNVRKRGRELAFRGATFRAAIDRAAADKKSICNEAAKNRTASPCSIFWGRIFDMEFLCSAADRSPAFTLDIALRGLFDHRPVIGVQSARQGEASLRDS